MNRSQNTSIALVCQLYFWPFGKVGISVGKYYVNAQ